MISYSEIHSIHRILSSGYNERAVIYNHKTHADDGLLITRSSDNINTCSGGADKHSLRFEVLGWYNSLDCKRKSALSSVIIKTNDGFLNL